MVQTTQILDHLWCLDTGYRLHQGTASYLLADGDTLALFDCGVNNSVPILIEQITSLGFKIEQIRALFLTHAHLDHAGGAGKLMDYLPEATIYGHKDALKHLIDPSNLEKGVKAVYGEDFFTHHYGRIMPIKPSRCHELDDGNSIQLQNKSLKAIYTPGHAWHHHAYFCPEDSTIIAGDAFGFAVKRLPISQPFYLPTTPPSQFHPEEMIRSLQKIKNCGATTICVTHFGKVPDINQALNILMDLVKQSVTLIQTHHHLSNDELCYQWVELCLNQLSDDWQKNHPNTLTIIKTALLEEATLNVQGLRYWINKQLAH